MDDRRRRFEAQALPHLDAAYNLARWLSRSSPDADDIVQEAMLRAFRNFDALRGGDVKAWLLTIVRNCHLTMAARRSRQPLTSIDENDTDGATALVSDMQDPESASIQADERRKLDIAIATLPEEYREVLVLREMEDMSYSEIAVVTGAPIGTVMSRLARARAALKEKWLNRVGEPCHDVR
jgi:RNA polymerase sigma-70 factor (ECF subfamily)